MTCKWFQLGCLSMAKSSYAHPIGQSNSMIPQPPSSLKLMRIQKKENYELFQKFRGSCWKHSFNNSFQSYLNIIYEACIYFILALGRVPCGKIMTTFLCRAKETGKDPTPFSWATGLGHIIRGKVHLLLFFSDSICPFQSSPSFITFHHYHFSTLR